MASTKGDTHTRRVYTFGSPAFPKFVFQAPLLNPSSVAPASIQRTCFQHQAATPDQLKRLVLPEKYNQS